MAIAERMMWEEVYLVRVSIPYADFRWAAALLWPMAVLGIGYTEWLQTNIGWFSQLDQHQRQKQKGLLADKSLETSIWQQSVRSAVNCKYKAVTLQYHSSRREQHWMKPINRRVLVNSRIDTGKTTNEPALQLPVVSFRRSLGPLSRRGIWEDAPERQEHVCAW